MRETSLQAYIDVVQSGVLGAAQLKVYRILYDHGPMSGSDLSAYGDVGPSGSTLFKRLSELHRMRVVEPIGTRKNTKTGHFEILWDVTSNQATPYRPLKSKEVQALTTRIEQLELLLRDVEHIFTLLDEENRFSVEDIRAFLVRSRNELGPRGDSREQAPQSPTAAEVGSPGATK